MEVFQEFGNDLILTDTGDLKPVSAAELSNQRIIRRLLTNPGDYIWHPEYGAGLPRFIGEPESQQIYNQIKGLIISQMYLEQSVQQTPPPQIQLSGLPNLLNCVITYTNVITNTQSVITFTV